MPRARHLLPLLATCACGGSDLVGEWEGSCLLQGEDGSQPLPFTLDILQVRRGELTGTGSYEYNGYTFQGEVDGTVDEDDDLSFELVGIYGGYTVTLFGEGDPGGEDRIEGDCSFFDVVGTFELER